MAGNQSARAADGRCSQSQCQSSTGGNDAERCSGHANGGQDTSDEHQRA